MNDNTDEIDVSSIFNGIKKGLISVVVLLFKGLGFIQKRWMILAGLLVVGVVLGCYKRSNFKPNQQADILVKINIESARYVYNEIALFNEKIKERDSVFLTKIGLNMDSLDVVSIQIEPVVNFIDVVNKYGGNGDNLQGLLKTVEFEKTDVVVSETFDYDYKFHVMHFDLSSTATKEAITKVLVYINDNELLKKLRLTRIENLEYRLSHFEKTNNQLTQMLEAYNSDKTISTPSISNENLVVDKQFNVEGVLTRKIFLIKEIELLKEELLYYDSIVVMVNRPNLANVKIGFGKNKLAYYPVLFIGAFLLLAFMRHSYFYLREIADNAEA